MPNSVKRLAYIQKTSWIKRGLPQSRPPHCGSASLSSASYRTQIAGLGANLLGNNLSNNFNMTGKREIGLYEIGSSEGFSNFNTVINFTIFQILRT